MVFGADSWVTLGAFFISGDRLLSSATFFLVGIQMAPVGTSLAFLRGMPGWHARWRFGFQPGLPPMRYGSLSS